MGFEKRVQIPSSSEPRSDKKVLATQKRGVSQSEETSGSFRKRMKLGEFGSIFRSIGENNNLHPYPSSDSRKLDRNVNTLKRDKCLKLTDDSDCGSSVNDENDPMTVWKGLKQNNFMSTNSVVIPMPMQMTKTRSRKKSNIDVMKKNKKIELANKGHVDRFTILAAPSGLLNGLNPGIINHVRNSRQVYSIIEALVNFERNDNRRFQIKKEDSFVETNEIGDCASFGESVYMNSEVISGDDDSYTGDQLGLLTENTSFLSNAESADVTSVNSLSVQAANISSQWLELLNQDIRGRLAALRRSKKRVRGVISTEFPLLIARELSSDKASAEAHFARWNNLFVQMDKALDEEENRLASWLNQVKAMQSYCERGLHQSSLYHAAPVGHDNRLGEADNSEADLDIGAAAASIYSTCNFLLKENLSFC